MSNNNAAADDPVASLMDALLMASRRLRAWMREGSGVTVPQFRVLSFLHTRDSSSLSELASHLGVTPPSASRLVESMASHGLLKVEEDPRDRRRLLLRLTDAGRGALSSARAYALSALSARLSGISREEVLAASAVLRTLAGGD
ncbi:MAG: MarR family winged helix-turn-helix transcriptional regulator [Conexivisphaera sp.]